MRTNKLVWLGLGTLVLMSVIVVINKSNDTQTLAQTESDTPKKNQAHVKAMPNSVEGDTVVESLSEVQARYSQTNDTVKRQQETIESLTSRLKELEASQGRADNGDNPIDKIASQLSNVTGQMSQLSKQFATQTEQLQTTSANGYSFTDSDLGWGEGQTDPSSRSNPYKRPSSNPGPGASPSLTNRLSGYVSVVPIIKNAAQDSLNQINEATEQATGKSLTGLKPKKAADVKPVYTIPSGATLMDNVAMTALIGRVPVGDKLKDPFPVKIIVGNDNLATNGIKIPGLKGIIFQGIASGNWNLSCVSVHLTQATYTFNDGRIQHMLGEDVGNRGGSQSNNPIGDETVSGAIGYVTDKFGVPCISGQRVTDAHKQIAALGLLGAGAGYFEGQRDTEVTNIVGDQRTSSAVTGDNMKYTYNNMAANGMNSIVDFYKDRFRDTFDAIVSPPGAKMTLHIQKDLLIDYDPNARKVAYSQFETGEFAHALD